MTINNLNFKKVSAVNKMNTQFRFGKEININKM